MKDKMQYYVLKEKAVPEVLLKVVEAKRLIDSGKTASVQEATESVGISRSSFYKYKDEIYTLSLHDALPISFRWMMSRDFCPGY